MGWRIELDGDVAVVVMAGHPANVQDERFFAEFDRVFTVLEAEHRERAVVLASERGPFSAGLDFESVFALLASRDAARVRAWFERYRALNLRLWRHPAPTVAACEGHAFAGGLVFALACDLRVASARARFALNEVPIGIPMPTVYCEIIRHACGTRAAHAAVLFGQTMDAGQALAAGLLHEVVPEGGALARAVALARLVPPGAFAGFAFSKRALQAPGNERIDGPGRAADEAIAELVSSDAAIALRAARYREIKGSAAPWA